LSILTVKDVFDELAKALHSLFARVIPNHAGETPLVAHHSVQVVHDTARKLLHIGGATGRGNCHVALLRQVHSRADALQPSPFLILSDKLKTCRVWGDDICASGELEHGGLCLGWL